MEKWKLTEMIVCYSDEYATDITDNLNNLNKTILQEVPYIASLNQSLHFGWMWNHDTLDLRQICALQMRELWQNLLLAGPNVKAFNCFYALF